AEVITHFDQSDFNEEDKVLWYQEQISRIVAPIESDLAFNEPNKELVKNLANKLLEMQSQQESTLAALQKTKEREMQISQAKEAALTEVMSLNEQKRQQQAALAARFSRVQSLFDPSEADVYRQMDNVLIRAHGFSFPSGSSEIESENFALINKIVEAIEQFPESRILVSGHTDNVGSDPFNKNLSQQRADKVAKFLREVGRIDAGRLASKGYGKERPVAPNETAEGRAANRRVEVLIINNPDSVNTVGQIPADIDR
ncbi:MAG: OmpA family protein, partial [Exilibacterium sp.]